MRMGIGMGNRSLLTEPEVPTHVDGDAMTLPELNDEDQFLRLENQLCFPLYTAARLMVQVYKPFLDELDLTYPQYLVMMVLWERDNLSVSRIGEMLKLDSATLTQILTKLEKVGYIERARMVGDARTVLNRLTRKGFNLKTRARQVPGGMATGFGSCLDELAQMKPMITRLLDILEDRRNRDAASGIASRAKAASVQA